MTEATNHSYVDDMLDGRTGTPEVRFQQAAVTGRCCGVRGCTLVMLSCELFVLTYQQTENCIDEWQTGEHHRHFHSLLFWTCASRSKAKKAGK